MSNPPHISNPYQPPVAEMSGEDPVDASVVRRWLAVFALNLPLPLYLGAGATSGAGITGMISAVAVIFLSGMWLCWRFPRLVRIMTTGGFLTALSQIVPVLHFIAGLIGFGVADSLHLLEDDSGFGKISTARFLAGFTVTAVTAVILLVTAAVSGAVVRAAYQIMTGNQQSRTANPN